MPAVSALNGAFLANRIAAFNWRGDGARAGGFGGARQAFARDVLAIGLKLPRLDRVGTSQVAQVDTFDRRGRPAQLNLNFTKTGARTIQVDVAGAGISAAGSTSFNIHLNGNDKIQGFDTDRSGTIDTAPTAEIDLDGYGNKIRFQFDNSQLGPLNFSTLSLGGEYLDLLQSVSGKLRSTGVSIGAGAGPSGPNVIDGTAGDDVLASTAAEDLINGYAGSDTVDYSGDVAAVNVDLENQTGADGSGNTDTYTSIENAIGSNFDDTLTGSSDANDIAGGAGNDSIDGAGGNDTLAGGIGDDTLDGGTGTDTADYSGEGAGVTVNLNTGTATDGNGDTDSLNSIENVTGSAFNDDLTGDNSANVITGAAGNDTLAGGTGNDLIDGGLGNDSLIGGADDDTLAGGIGDDTLDGGSGNDTADYSGDAGGVTVDLCSGNSTDGNGDSDTLNNIENVTGSGFNDDLTGDGSANVISGGAGNDTIVGGAGDDTIDGGISTDTIDYSGNDAVTVNLATGTADDGNGGTDTLSNIENVNGSNQGDSLTGDGAANVIDGGGGNDTLVGGGGDDTLTGGSGDDQFILDDNGGDLVITDFTSGWSFTDELDFSNVASINDYTDVFAATTDNADGDAVIDLGNGTTVTLIGVSESDLNRFRDFKF